MAQLPISSKIQPLSENSDKSVTNAAAIISTKNEIIIILQLENSQNKDQIVSDLLQNGRQTLVLHQKCITPQIYTQAMVGNNSQLLNLLKHHFQQQWETQYCSSNEWFIPFLKQYQNEENHDLYESVLTRTAEYGNKYMKNCPVLSIVLQFLFNGIDDNCLETTNIFDDLWFTITNEGIKSIEKYCNYIDNNIMNEQINNKQSVLFQAVRRYYRTELFLLFTLRNIEDKENIYDLALDSVAEHGWLTGVEAIRDKIISVKAYTALLQDIQLLLEIRKITSCVEDNNTASADIDSGSTFNEKCNNQRENVRAITPSESVGVITVRFRPTNINYDVHIREDMTVGDVIIDVCRQAQMYIHNDCYLWLNSCELNINETVVQAGLYPTSSLIKDLPEVRLKYVKVLQTSSHLSKKVLLASPEHIDYDQLLNVPLPSTKNHIVPTALKKIAEQIAQRTSCPTQPTQNDGTVLIPLPNFSRQSIDSLPTIYLTLPLSPDQFDWNIFLGHLANDLEIDRRNLIIVSAKEGSTKLKIKLQSKSVRTWKTMKKLEHKLVVMVIPKCQQYVTERLPSNTSKVDKIQIELKNFAERKSIEDTSSLSLDEIDLALRLSERPAIIKDDSWNFMIEKSREIRTAILQSIQSCSDEYVIDHASMIYNEQIYDKYEKLTHIDKNEKILFHGTSTINFDGIFEKNFQYNSGAKRTDGGWYGQGIYFSNSPKKALNYAKSDSTISYLICSLVRLGETLTVTDMRFKGKHMHPDYDSHYVPIRVDGDPVSQGETPAFEEFVIKTSNQIMPLYVVGVLKVDFFVIWRDAKITNEANSTVFEAMKQRYTFNIYGTQTSAEALDILNFKLTNEGMKCVVVTNGADDGKGFVRQCRSIRSSLPVIVYCTNKTYHQQWATTFPAPKINVTSSPEEVFDIITNTLQK